MYLSTDEQPNELFGDIQDLVNESLSRLTDTLHIGQQTISQRTFGLSLTASSMLLP